MVYYNIMAKAEYWRQMPVNVVLAYVFVMAIQQCKHTLKQKSWEKMQEPKVEQTIFNCWFRHKGLNMLVSGKCVQSCLTLYFIILYLLAI